MSNQPTVIVQQPESNGVGLAGLIFSIFGWVTCGLMCIPGVFLSLLGLIGNKPKGTAVAGVIIGAPGVIFFLVVGMGIIAAALGFGPVANEAAKQLRELEAKQAQNQPLVEPE